MKAALAATALTVALLAAPAAAQRGGWTLPPFPFTPPGLPEPDGGYLGVYLSEVTADTVAEAGLPGEYGARVREVVEDSPAEQAGLREGDVVTGLNGVRVESVRQFQRMVSELPAGREVELQIHRDGRAETLPARLGTRAATARSPGGWDFWPPVGGEFMPDDPAGDTPPLWPGLRETESRGRLGVVLQPLTPQLAEFFHAPGGALVATVIEDSPAALAGLRAGDVIVGVDADEVQTPDDARRFIRARAGQLIELQIVRGGERLAVGADLAPAGAPPEMERPAPADEPEPAAM